MGAAKPTGNPVASGFSRTSPKQETSPAVIYALIVLFAINLMNFFDRTIFGAIGEAVRREWGLGDAAIGALGTAFTLLYAVVGVPFGRLSDRFVRKRILGAGLFVWSLLTAASGLARNYWQLFAVRLGVGIGEATCAPASNSLIGDLFPNARRAWALSVFMLGLPLGNALAYAVGGPVTQAWGWRAAFFVAGVPGLICVLAVRWLREPQRGLSETHAVGDRRRPGSPYALVLSIPTMWWLIASGALHNFNMYAIAQFLSPFLIRFHGVNIRQAGLLSTMIYGLSGVAGLLLGGIAADAAYRVRRDGRLLVGGFAIAASAPLMFLALGRPAGDVVGFSVLMGIGVGVIYAYYSSVYSTIQDIIEPSLRGTAMALYFCAMYVLGASLGPVGTGLASDYFTAQAADAAGVLQHTSRALEPFRAVGLHRAMYLIPTIFSLLAVVLFAASRTVTKDVEKLQTWMRQPAASAAR
jgi:MFS family permease